MVAKEEVRLKKGSCRAINQALCSSFPNRTLEAIKGLRKTTNLRYWNVFSRLQAESSSSEAADAMLFQPVVSQTHAQTSASASVRLMHAETSASASVQVHIASVSSETDHPKTWGECLIASINPEDLFASICPNRISAEPAELIRSQIDNEFAS